MSKQQKNYYKTKVSRTDFEILKNLACKYITLLWLMGSFFMHAGVIFIEYTHISDAIDGRKDR